MHSMRAAVIQCSQIAGLVWRGLRAFAAASGPFGMRLVHSLDRYSEECGGHQQCGNVNETGNFLHGSLHE